MTQEELSAKLDTLISQDQRAIPDVEKALFKQAMMQSQEQLRRELTEKQIEQAWTRWLKERKLVVSEETGEARLWGQK